MLTREEIDNKLQQNKTMLMTEYADILLEARGSYRQGKVALSLFKFKSFPAVDDVIANKRSLCLWYEQLSKLLNGPGGDDTKSMKFNVLKALFKIKEQYTKAQAQALINTTKTALAELPEMVQLRKARSNTLV